MEAEQENKDDAEVVGLIIAKSSSNDNIFEGLTFNDPISEVMLDRLW